MIHMVILIYIFLGKWVLEMAMTSNMMKAWKPQPSIKIYPKSFCDSGSKGTGDIKGIISKLDYLKHLSVDAIWLTPAMHRQWLITTATIFQITTRLTLTPALWKTSTYCWLKHISVVFVMWWILWLTIPPLSMYGSNLLEGTKQQPLPRLLYLERSQ